MKALYIYNPHSALEVSLTERVKIELGSYVELVDVAIVSADLKKLVRATPALILAPDYLQGSELTEDGVDSELLMVAEMYKKLEEDELFVHGDETQRLDNFVNNEKQEAIDEYTLELIDGGVL